MLNIRFLETLVWLVRLKSFSAAADKLNTTQSNVSSRIASLEDQLNVKLYVRGGKEFRLTSAGLRLFEYAEQMTALTAKMHRELNVSEEDNKAIRVGIIEMVTLSWLQRFVRLIRELDLVTEVTFITDTSGGLVKALRNDEIDLAFIWGPANEPQMTNEHICAYSMAWLGTPRFYDGSESMDVVELTKLPLIPHKSDASGHAVVKEYFAAYGIDSTQRSDDGITLSSYSLATAVHLIRTGQGVMAMSPLLMEKELAEGSVAVLPVKQALPPIYLTACYKPDTARALVKRLVGLAKTAAGEFSIEANKTHFWV